VVARPAADDRIGRCAASQHTKDNFSWKRSGRRLRISIASKRLVSFQGRFSMKILVTAAIFSALAFTPASAEMMSCSGDNMAKTGMMMGTMADGPAKMGMGKEMGMANMEMSKGNMRGACMHYMKAQKMSMMK
jgi:hypothetical protein